MRMFVLAQRLWLGMILLLLLQLLLVGLEGGSTKC